MGSGAESTKERQKISCKSTFQFSPLEQRTFFSPFSFSFPQSAYKIKHLIAFQDDNLCVLQLALFRHLTRVGELHHVTWVMNARWNSLKVVNVRGEVDICADSFFASSWPHVLWFHIDCSATLYGDETFYLVQNSQSHSGKKWGANLWLMEIPPVWREVAATQRPTRTHARVLEEVEKNNWIKIHWNAMKQGRKRGCRSGENHSSWFQ